MKTKKSCSYLPGKGRKGHYKELFETTRKKGYLHVRIDGDIHELSYGLKLDRYKIHDIELVIDQIVVQGKQPTASFKIIEARHAAR